MITTQQRLVAISGGVYYGEDDNPEDTCECNVWDWDSLRVIRMKGKIKVLGVLDGKESAVLAKFVDNLSLQVKAVTVDERGLLTAVSSKPEDDHSMHLPYLPFSSVDSILNCRTITYSELECIDRLGAGVDLCQYNDNDGALKKVAFKFNPFGQQDTFQTAWDELNLLTHIPSHPNIVPFDRVVLEDVESRIIGFTTKFIPGGTLQNPDIIFRFEWLQQLTQVVDYINLSLGIMHQDIAPRNLLIDPETNNLLLFDFNMAACGARRLRENQSDVMGVVFTLHEIITGEDHSPSKCPYWNRALEMVQNLEEWVPSRRLDADVSTFRTFLNDWVAKRSADTKEYFHAPHQITWPNMPIPPDNEVPFECGRNEDGVPVMVTGYRTRRIAEELGQYCFRWERPSQRMLQKKQEALEQHF